MLLHWYSVLCTVESLYLLHFLFYILIYMFLEMMHWLDSAHSCKPNISMSWSTSELRGRLAPWNRFKPSSKIFFCGSFVFFVSCVSHVFASVYCCLVVTCWERGDLLLVMFIIFLLLSHVVSWVRCGNWLYRFLIFVVFLTLYHTVTLPVTYMVASSIHCKVQLMFFVYTVTCMIAIPVM